MGNREYLSQLLPLSLQPQARRHPQLCSSSVFSPLTLTPFLGRRLSCSFKSQLDAPAPLIQLYWPARSACVTHQHLSPSTETLSCGSNACTMPAHKVQPNTPQTSSSSLEIKNSQSQSESGMQGRSSKGRKLTGKLTVPA